MSAILFQPQGEKSKRQMVYELVVDVVERDDIGGVVTKEEIEELAGGVWMMPSVTRDLERSHKRTLVAVRNHGYRVAHPNETLALVHKRRRSAHRQARRGRETAQHADHSKLTPDERSAVEDIAVRMAGAEQMIAALARGQRRLEQAQQQMRFETEERLGDVERAVAKLREKGLI